MTDTDVETALWGEIQKTKLHGAESLRPHGGSESGPPNEGHERMKELGLYDLYDIACQLCVGIPMVQYAIGRLQMQPRRRGGGVRYFDREQIDRIARVVTVRAGCGG